MTPLEDRLRAEMRAESEQIEPGSIPLLRLPAQASRPCGPPRRRGPWRWPEWATALAAAATVAAVIVGALTIAHTISRSTPNPPAAAGPAWYSGISPYYAYAVPGSGCRHAQRRLRCSPGLVPGHRMGESWLWGQMLIEPSGVIRSGPAQMWLLDTAAPGTSLAASKLVTLRDALGFSSFITPDGTKLIGEYAGKPVRAGGTTESGALGVYSARTGALLRVVAQWQLHGRGPLSSRARQMVAWSSLSGSRLIVEMPRGELGEAGFLTGDKFTPLPHVALAPLLNAMNSGGFQTSGGYVGFAW